MAEIC
jgi:hypothetical protein